MAKVILPDKSINVLYQQTYTTDNTVCKYQKWLRPIEMFYSLVDYNGKQIPRFASVNSELVAPFDDSCECNIAIHTETGKEYKI